MSKTISVAEPVSRLVEALRKLPGLGPKSAQRVAYYLLQADAEQVKALTEAITSVKQQVTLCAVCFNVTNLEKCSICGDPERDPSVLCVVEKPMDILPMERTRAFNGLYHVLHGTISPADGIGPDQLKVRELLLRLQDGTVKEAIMATNPNVEGEATALYLNRLLVPMGVRVTRLARGLPFGSDLEYADEATLTSAIEHRRNLG